MNDDGRDVHWLSLGGFAVFVFVVVPLIIEIAWFRATGHWGNEAFLVAGFLSSLIVIRAVLRAYSIPEEELVSDRVAMNIPTPPRSDDAVQDPAPEKIESAA
jgi:hypothetical protein